MARLIDADKLELDAEWDDYYDGFMSYSQSQIRAAPTVEIEPVRCGRWVYDDEIGIWKCSLCSRAAISSGYGQELSEHCPRCGARMVGG